MTALVSRGTKRATAACCAVDPRDREFARRWWFVLDRDEREYCAAGLPSVDRIAGRVAAKRAVANLFAKPPRLDAIRIARAASGEPSVWIAENDASIALSFAHRAGLAVALAGAAPTRLGVGVDLVDRASIARSEPDFRRRLLARILADEEHEAEWCTPDVDGVLAAITAKEAAGKVLKRLAPRMSWRDVACSAVSDVPDPVLAYAQALESAVGAGDLGFAAAHAACIPNDLAVFVVWAPRANATYGAAIPVERSA